MKDTRTLVRELFPQDQYYPFEHVAIQTMEAYADTHSELDDDMRQLQWFCPYKLRDVEFLRIASKCIGTYNAFNVDTMKALVIMFGESDYFLARQNSVCICVRPGVPLHMNDRRFIERLHALQCDEFSYDTAIHMFRIWWD